MKPRNRYEKQVAVLSEKLPPLSEKQKEYAFSRCNPTTGYYSHRKVWCLHCGQRFEYEADESRFKSSYNVLKYPQKVVCPHCKAKLELEKNGARTYKDESGYFFSIITTFKGWQVCRHFIVTIEERWNKAPAHSVREVIRNWLDSKGHEVFMTCGVNFVPYRNVYFANGPLVVRDVRCAEKSMYLSNDFYVVNPYCLYPWKKVLPVIRRNGFNGDFAGLPPNELFRMLIRDREAESLYKNGQFGLLKRKYLSGAGEYQLRHQESIRIAIRNRYIVKDGTMWFDYLDLLEYFNKDLRNAFYVCPADLKEAHDRLLEKKRRAEEKKRIEETMAEAARYEKLYRKQKGRFFGLCFESEGITISVISSVKEMAEEGARMHHCVYDNGYYKKKNSLILSAKDARGERLETIEINLKTFQIIQSQGHCNQNSSRHEDILRLMKQNINIIKKAA